MPSWSQPTLGGPALRRFSISASYSWPDGWSGKLLIETEGTHELMEAVTIRQLDTDALPGSLALCMQFVLTLLDLEGPPSAG